MSIIIDNTIHQLRQFAPILRGNVAGAADYLQGLGNGPGDSVSLPLPAAYVVPAGSTSNGPENMAGGILQYVRRWYGVIVELDARADRRGQTPAMQLEEIEEQISGAMVGFVPTEKCIVRGQVGYWFSGSHKLDLNRFRLFWQFTYALDTQLDGVDGWNVADAGEPLEAIELDIFKVPPQDMLKDDPAAIVHIPTQPGESLWDVGPDGQPRSIWDQGASRWDRYIPGMPTMTPFVPGGPPDTAAEPLPWAISPPRRRP